MNSGNARQIARISSSRLAVVSSRWLEFVIQSLSWSAALGERVEHHAGVLDHLLGRALLRVQDLQHLVGVLANSGSTPRKSEKSGAVALDALAEVLLPDLEALAGLLVERAEDLVQLHGRRDLGGLEAPVLGDLAGALRCRA